MEVAAPRPPLIPCSPVHRPPSHDRSPAAPSPTSLEAADRSIRSRASADITLTGRRHAARHARRPLRSPFATAPRSPVCRSLRYAYALAGLPRRDGSALALALCRYITMPAQAVRRAPHHLNPVPACHSAHALGCYTLQREIAPARVCESGRGRLMWTKHFASDGDNSAFRLIFFSVLSSLCFCPLLSSSPPADEDWTSSGAISDAFAGAFSIDEHPQGMPEPCLPFLASCCAKWRTPNPNNEDTKKKGTDDSTPQQRLPPRGRKLLLFPIPAKLAGKVFPRPRPRAGILSPTGPPSPRNPRRYKSF
nr:unnamed protein product [Digitaria exilis]